MRLKQQVVLIITETHSIIKMEAKILYSNFVDKDELSEKDKLSGTSITSKASQIPEDMMSTPARTQIQEDMMANPVGILQEKYCRLDIPVYSLVHSEGDSHAPTFTFEVALGKRRAVGGGNSKKCAKRAAAQAMLDLLANDETLNTSGEVTNSELDGEASDSQMDPNVTLGNSVGSLSEMCVKKGMRLPRYQLDRIVGQSHNPHFYMVCELGEFRKIGVAGSKKDAKREAAQKMITSLTERQIL